MPGVDLSDVVLPDDLQRALISKVESGQFPSKGALIEKALRSFLIEEPAQEAPEEDRSTEPQPSACRVPSSWMSGSSDRGTSLGPAVRRSLASSFMTKAVAGSFPR